ncbi:hypothetical protein F4604DRAFT_1902253 [Suillus subluteus]|nr:hypothetical protein F4604DRAFT_1902253 [Suillus subluteus]
MVTVVVIAPSAATVAALATAGMIIIEEYLIRGVVASKTVNNDEVVPRFMNTKPLVAKARYDVANEFKIQPSSLVLAEMWEKIATVHPISCLRVGTPSMIFSRPSDRCPGVVHVER